ncbi:MAG: hypothetical protein K2W95_21170 [Candidatus Obscuribacterales bacterium]|nr:hypothetical protein [Candidatus Obscuribacterales bacterium]
MRARLILMSGVFLAFYLSAGLTLNAAETEFSQYLSTFAGTIHDWSDFDKRLTYIESAINDKLAKNTISTERANALLAELALASKTVQDLRTAGKQLSFSRALVLTRKINSVLAMAAQSSSVPKDAVTMRKELQERLQACIAEGALSRLDAADCQHELKHVIDIETTFLNANEGKLTAKQEKILSGDIEKISNQLDQQMRISRTATAEFYERRLAVEAKLADAVAKGRLSANQAELIRAELTHLSSTLQAHITANGAPSESSLVELAIEIDKLDERIESSVKADKDRGLALAGDETSAQNPTARQEDCTVRKRLLRLRIDSNTKSGAISADRAADFLREIELIDALESAYSEVPGGMTPEQSIKIEQQIASIELRVREATSRKAVPKTTTGTKRTPSLKMTPPRLSLEDRWSALERRIADAQQPGKLTTLETTLLKREYDRLSQFYLQVRRDAKSLPPAEHAKVADEIDKLDKLISAEINSRGSVTGSYR